MRLLPVALACAAALVSPSRSDACSCARSRLDITPGPNIAAPLNVQVRLSWWVGDSDVTEASLALVAKDGAAVAIDRRAWTSGVVRTVILTPRKSLAKKTTYQIKATSKAGVPKVVGEITTGEVDDNTPPQWKGIGKVQYVHAPAVCCNCSTGDPWASLDIVEGHVADDQTANDTIAYGIWPAEGKLDATALLAIVPAWNGAITLGHRSMCSPNNFTLPAPSAKLLKLRVAPIDLAGNAGVPADVRIDLTNPQPGP
jgi:hypothetical protein